MKRDNYGIHTVVNFRKSWPLAGFYVGFTGLGLDSTNNKIPRLASAGLAPCKRVKKNGKFTVTGFLLC